jgi:hypothetical protein
LRYGDNREVIYAKDCGETGDEMIEEFIFDLRPGTLHLDELNIKNKEFMESLNIRKLSKNHPQYSIMDNIGAKFLDTFLNAIFKD